MLAISLTVDKKKNKEKHEFVFTESKSAFTFDLQKNHQIFKSWPIKLILLTKKWIEKSMMANCKKKLIFVLEQIFKFSFVDPEIISNSFQTWWKTQLDYVFQLFRCLSSLGCCFQVCWNSNWQCYFETTLCALRQFINWVLAIPWVIN